MIINIKSNKRTDLIDITEQVRKSIPPDMKNGLVYVFSLHTTGAITINENADPDVVRRVKALQSPFLIPDSATIAFTSSVISIISCLFVVSKTISISGLTFRFI